MADYKYWAGAAPKRLGDHVVEKATRFREELSETNRMRLWKNSHGQYYRQYYEGGGVTAGDDAGDMLSLSVNHYRNIGLHLKQLVTQQRPTFLPQAVNTDYASQGQAILAKGLLDYYAKEKHLDGALEQVVETALVTGDGYLFVGWDHTGGRVYDYHPETQAPIHEGDLVIEAVHPVDVVFDTTIGTGESQWMVRRQLLPKGDLIAKFPEHSDTLSAMGDDKDYWLSDLDATPFSQRYHDREDYVTLYTLYHLPCPALPAGRMAEVLPDGTVLTDSPLPYRRIPLIRLKAAHQQRNNWGYSSMFDLLPLQNALDGLYSTAATNAAAFGVQCIAVEQGSNLSAESVGGGGLNVVQYPKGGNLPTPLQLQRTAPETFGFIRDIERQMEILSGVNSVVRGEPQSSLESGTALALVQSMALQFSQSLQSAYIYLVEQTGQMMVDLLRDFAKVPRVAAITGQSQRTVMKEFTGKDLSAVNRVHVSVGNPLSQTTAGKLQIAENLVANFANRISPEQYLQVLQTGQLNTLLEGQTSELLLIKDENEKIRSGEEPVRAIATDQHSLHIKEHRALLASVSARQDQELSKRALDHILEHIQLLRNTDPALLAALGEQSIAAPPGAPGGPQPPQQQQAPAPEASGVVAPESSAAEPPPPANMPTPPEGAAVQ